jgi:Flp pilus assembly protein TadD
MIDIAANKDTCLSSSNLPLQGSFAVIHSSRLNAWLFSAVSLAALASGCNSTPKNPMTAAKQQIPAPATTPAATNPGSLDFSVSKTLKNPAKVHLAYALWEEQEGNLVGARNSYEKVLDESPKNVEAMIGLARLDIALGRMDDAEKRLFKAQKIAPKNSQVAVSLGQYYAAKNDLPRALEQMQLARTHSPYDPAFAYHLGHIQAKMGDVTSALANFTEAVGPAEAHYNLAYMLHERGDLAGAEEHLQRALSLKPELPQAQSLLLAVRQERQGGKQLAQRPRLTPAPTTTPAAPVQAVPSAVQPASYTEPARTSSFDPAPAR